MSAYAPLATAEAIVAVVAAALPQLRVAEPPARIPQGFASESWRVVTDDGALIVKLRRRGVDAAKLHSQLTALRLARSAGIAAPELLYAGASPVVRGRTVVIARYLSGVDAEEALPGLDTEQRAAFFSDFGAAVGRLHGIGLPWFSDRLGEPGADTTDWTTVVRRTAEQAAARNRALGTLLAAEVASIAERLIRDASAVAPVVTPALTHRDLYLPNVLVETGRFKALLDFELAKGWDPVFDFVKLGMWVFERWPGGIAAFLTAYRCHTGRVPQAEERLALCLGLENFVALWNWQSVGEEYLATAARGRLRDWRARSYPAWLGTVALMLD